MINNNIVTGVDIGGSHITAALVDISVYKVVPDTTVRTHVDPHADAQAIIQNWCIAITECRNKLANISSKIGIAIPGPFDYEQGISLIKGLGKFEALYELNVKELLAQELGLQTEDIFMMNDASCFIKGEALGGAGVGADKALGITLGTGLGSGLHINGKIIDGTLYCMPYRDGTAEDYLSARWFVSEYYQLTGKTVAGVKDIFDHAQTDILARDLFKTFGKNLGEVLINYLQNDAVSTIIIGGNIIGAWKYFIMDVEKVFADRGENITIKKALLGENAAMIGAAGLCRG